MEPINFDRIIDRHIAILSQFKKLQAGFVQRQTPETMAEFDRTWITYYGEMLILCYVDPGQYIRHFEEMDPFWDVNATREDAVKWIDYIEDKIVKAHK